MRFACSALITYVVSRFRSHESLRLENIALRHQLFVYQRTVTRPTLCPSDRLFWVWLSRLWPGWRHALEFVQPRAVITWQNKRFREYWRRLSQRSKPGRPALAKEGIALIRDMWRSNPTWGSPRIVGARHKLGITVAKSTVEKYRPRPTKPPSPTRLHRSLDMDTPEPRPMQPPELGSVRKRPEVGGLHHHYERTAA